MCRCNGRDVIGDGINVTVNGSAASSTSSPSHTISHPTFSDEKPKKIIDTTDLNVEDMESLKKSDPFLYFSIPAVRRAAVHNKEVDLSSLRDSQASRVERRSRISFECHTDLLLEDLMDMEELPGLPGLSILNGLDAIMGSMSLNSTDREQ